MARKLRAKKLYKYIKNKFSAETEILDLSNGDSRIIDPALKSETYFDGVGLYIVPMGFCRNQL